MALLIDYLEESSAWLRGKKATLRGLELQYRRSYDRDLKREMAAIKQEIRKKSAEISDELISNLEELRYIARYFPELLLTFMEDGAVGPIIRNKEWLLNFRPVPSREAAMKLEMLRQSRAQIRDARKFLRGWIGTVEARSFSATYPVLRGHLHGQMDKDEVIAALDKADRLLLREGWLLLLTDTLIEIPLSKFVMKLNKVRYEETAAKGEARHTRGRGTVAEAAALKKLQKLVRQREHYERVIRQLLLANPDYLRSLRKSRNWLSRGKKNPIQRIAEGVTPHTVKERAWLNDMRKRLEG